MGLMGLLIAIWTAAVLAASLPALGASTRPAPPRWRGGAAKDLTKAAVSAARTSKPGREAGRRWPKAAMTAEERRETAIYFGRIVPILRTAQRAERFMEAGGRRLDKGDLKAAARSLRKANDLYKNASDRLQGTTPPERAARVHSLLQEGMRDYVSGTALVAEAAEKDSRDLFEQGVDDIKSANRKMGQAGREIRRVRRQM